MSSLLHSCTLVMAGIFAAFNAGIESSSVFVFTSVASLAVVALLARAEKDTKRTVAISTVIMVCAIWSLLAVSESISAVAICLIHAGYKSASFLAIGRILTKTTTYSDALGISAAMKTIFLVVGTFLLAFRSSAYAAQKHSVDAVLVSDGSDFVLQSIFALGGLVL